MRCKKFPDIDYKELEELNKKSNPKDELKVIYKFDELNLNRLKKEVKQQTAQEIFKEIDEWIETFYEYSSNCKEAEKYPDFQAMKEIKQKYLTLESISPSFFISFDVNGLTEMNKLTNEQKKKKLTNEQKKKMIERMTKSLKESYGEQAVREALTEGIPKLFEHFKISPDTEYRGDIILMFVMDDLKDLFDRGYEW
jgi:glutamyl/glutaminyl-tRNA synthetase